MRPLLSRAATAALMLVSLAACKKEDSDGTSATTLEVECIGMSKREALAGYHIIQSDVGGRCELMISDTVHDPTALQLLASGGANWGKPNTATLIINFAGKRFVARSGVISFTQYESSAASGRYELEGVEATTGEKAKLTGPIDFCNYGDNPKCPHQSSGVEALPKHVSFVGPDGFPAEDATSRANECRVLIDKKTSAARVDVQIAVLNGVNIARFRDKCGGGAGVPAKADFYLLLPGVSGPGTYGPIVSKPVKLPGGEPSLLPEFSLTVPTLYWFGNCLNKPGNLFEVHPIDGTSCTYKVTENPGKLEVSCKGAQHSEPAMVYWKQGDFNLSADCDVRYVN